MLTVALAWMLQQREVQGAPELNLLDTYLPGQREVILGPLPYRDSVMTVLHSREIPGTRDRDGLSLPVWDEYPIGVVRWSVQEGTLFDRPCRVVKLTGMTQSRIDLRQKRDRVTLQNEASTTWHLAPDGTILRQDEVRTGFSGTKRAVCTYGPEDIQVQVEENGRRKVTTVFPGPNMEKLQLQFRPMVVGGKVVIEEKEYCVYDPFTGGFEKRKARYGGLFGGSWLQKTFKGRHFELDYGRYQVRAYVSDEGDLVKVDLPQDNFFILQSLPPGKSEATRGIP